MNEICRDRLMELPVHLFNLFSCSMCYKYLFNDKQDLRPNPRSLLTLISDAGSDVYPQNFSVIADVTNSTNRNLVCKSLNTDECTRWTDCCYAAISCCQKQLSTPKRNISNGLFCPRTWDGYGCFDDAEPDTRSYISCPSYIEHASTSETAYKDCSVNGTWWISPTTGSEWTNYSTCVPLQDQHTVLYVSLLCNIISLALLIPACAIFLSIRLLRIQNRIKLHICLFLSFILTSIVTIIWDFGVHLDRLENENHDTILYKNSGGCKFLYLCIRYVNTTTFFWMFCEGFYLHRLIVHAFLVPKTLIPYYLFGWVASWLPAATYAIVRSKHEEFNHSCWVHHAGDYEWLLYTPNLFCIGVNLAFLGNIMRILCSKLRVHPNEPSNYRKALKATFVLVPLFGLQQFIVIYRPDPGTRVAFIYEFVRVVINGTQGAVVSLIFCFLNGEVHSYLRSCLGRHVKFGSGLRQSSRKSSMTSATHFTSLPTSSDKRDNKQDKSDMSYIPLSTSSTANDVNNACTTNNGHVTFSI
ncbi:hypothetical protein ACF0H5_018423 [Mactra antiquata]